MNRRGRPPRSRLMFDVDPGLLRQVEEAAREQEVSTREFCIRAVRLQLTPEFRSAETEARQRGESTEDYCLNAIRLALDPYLWFYAATPTEREPAVPFLEDAKEIAVVGVTLASMWEEKGLVDFLKRRLAEARLPMTFVLVDPDMEDSHPTYRILDQRYGHEYGGSLRNGLRTSMEILQELSRVASENQAPFVVRASHDVPPCGMVIVDPGFFSCKMRIKLYIDSEPDIEPLFEVRSVSDQGKLACELFQRHYMRVALNTRPIDPRPPGIP